MPKSSNQKLKLIYLMKILLERTDETHSITMPEMNVDKKMELRHNGAVYEVSPWSLSWDDENYYLIAYARKMFGMYGGKEELVRIECDNSFAGVMIDRFGKDVSMIRLDEIEYLEE